MRGTAFKNDKKQENNFKMNITAKQYDATLADHFEKLYMANLLNSPHNRTNFKEKSKVCLP